MDKQIDHRIAILESQVDYLETELTYVNTQLQKCGFPEGIATLKKTIEELLIESPVDLPEDEG
jgi:hypothetical protein